MRKTPYTTKVTTYTRSGAKARDTEEANYYRTHIPKPIAKAFNLQHNDILIVEADMEAKVIKFIPAKVVVKYPGGLSEVSG